MIIKTIIDNDCYFRQIPEKDIHKLKIVLYYYNHLYTNIISLVIVCIYAVVSNKTFLRDSFLTIKTHNNWFENSWLFCFWLFHRDLKIVECLNWGYKEIYYVYHFKNCIKMKINENYEEDKSFES